MHKQPSDFTIGFIGLGNLGEPLCHSLVSKGFRVTVTDLDKAHAQRLLDAGAAWSDDIAGVCQGANVVITALPSVAASRKVVEGPGGVFEHLASGGAWIEMSTTDLNDLQRLQDVAKAKGIAVLECPVTGGVHLAHSGQITVLVGGEQTVFDTVRPILQAMGGEIIYMGKLGNASVVKVVTNMLAFIHLVAAGEAMMLPAKYGVDPDATWRAIRASSGNSFVHETESQVILNGSYNIGFTMDLACKDLGFATKFGREFGVPLDLASMTEQTFIRARQQYGGGAWSSQVVKLLEDALATDLRAPGFPEVLQ